MINKFPIFYRRVSNFNFGITDEGEVFKNVITKYRYLVNPNSVMNGRKFEKFILKSIFSIFHENFFTGNGFLSEKIWFTLLKCISFFFSIS